jgi:hypothetical protein
LANTMKKNVLLSEGNEIPSCLMKTWLSNHFECCRLRANFFLKRHTFEDWKPVRQCCFPKRTKEEKPHKTKKFKISFLFYFGIKKIKFNFLDFLLKKNSLDLPWPVDCRLIVVGN